MQAMCGSRAGRVWSFARIAKLFTVAGQHQRPPITFACVALSTPLAINFLVMVECLTTHAVWALHAQFLRHSCSGGTHTCLLAILNVVFRAGV